MSINLTKAISQLTITLGSERQDMHNIGEEWVVDITPPKRGRFLGSFGLKVKKQVRLELGYIEIPNDLEIDRKNLFRIRILDQNYDSGAEGVSIPLQLTDLKTRFQLFFNPAAIKDSTGWSQKDPKRRYSVVFKLTIFNTDIEEEICSTEETIIFTIAEVHTEPEVDMEIFYTPQRGLVYQRDKGVIEIGKISIDNQSKLKYNPPIDVCARLNVTLDGIPVDKQLISLDFGDNFYGNDSFKSEGTNVFSIRNYGSTILSGQNNRVVQIPIVADIQGTGNPYEGDRKYQVDLELTYQHHGEAQTDVIKKTGYFKLVRNVKSAELRVMDEISNKDIPNGSTHNLPYTKFSYDENSPKFFFPLSIRNTADNGLPHAGIVIGNFQYNVNFEEDNIVEDYEKALKREDVFCFSESKGGHLLTTIKNGFFQIDSKPGCKIPFQLTFSGRDIKRLCRIYNEKKNYHTTVLINFSFQYWLNDNGQNLERVIRDTAKPYNATLRLPLYQMPCDKLLGIDFGTSAIVCMYENTLLDLRGQKTSLFGDNDPHYELGTKFLSSNTVFRTNPNESNVSQLLSENPNPLQCPDFHSLAVCLSPTWNVEGQNHRFVLPCLKLMVGYELLPQLETYPNNQFTYHTGYGSSRRVNHLIENEKPTRLAYVDDIFDEVYRQLFLYFIKRSMPGNVPDEKINRIVLTVPNTFSPRHIETIRSIVKQSLNSSSVDIRDICFVSESDAVACYYLKNRQNINQYLGRSVSTINIVENILVYDMGAGTLDLSLFKLEPAENNTRKVTMLGKIGLSKAGNYLDFVLANIMAEIVEQTDTEVADKLKDYIHNISTDKLASARDLKNFIKEELKPIIGTNINEITLSATKYQDLGLTEDLHLSVSEFTQHPKYQEFIRDCTQNLIDNFFNFLQLPADFRLDTAIISGRSSKLLDILTSLYDTLAPYKRENVFKVYNTSDGDMDVSKTSVVEGAMKYAKELFSEEPTITFKEDSITPCYGVIYCDQDGSEHYKELFNPRVEMPIDEEVNGEMIRTYRTQDVTLDLRFTDDLKLIQSYSFQTEEDWKMGKMDYISTVQTYNTSHFGRLSEAQLHVEIDAQNMLKLVVNHAVTDDFSPNRIDLTRSSIGDSLWPRVSENAN